MTRLIRLCECMYAESLSLSYHIDGAITCSIIRRYWIFLVGEGESNHFQRKWLISTKGAEIGLAFSIANYSGNSLWRVHRKLLRRSLRNHTVIFAYGKCPTS